MMNNNPLLHIDENDPKSFGVPHDSWRPHQLDSIKSILKINNGIIIAQAPTGAGKSSIASALASDPSQKVLVLTETKMLQKQYGEGYGFEILQGKGNYQCEHPEAPGYMNVETCKFRDGGRCGCTYYDQKDRTLTSSRACLNYQLFLTSKWFNQAQQTICVLDESHRLPDKVTEYAGFTVSPLQVMEWGITELPQLRVMDTLQGKKHTDTIRKWIIEASGELEKIVENLDHEREFDPDDLELAKKWRRAKYLHKKLIATYEAINAHEDDWYIKINKEGALVCKPLTAKYHAPYYFLNFPLVILMSATIGDHQAYAQEMGIDEFVPMTIPNQWPPETRPIQVLDVPSMGRSSWKKHGDKIFEWQADAVAEAIKEHPNNWSGVLHVTRKTEALKVADRLARRGLQDRIWTPMPGTGTDHQMQAYEDANRAKSGLLAVVWSWREGVDLRDAQICISLKVPYPFLGDPFELERMKYNSTTFQWRAANGLMQSLGRTRRGEREDYDVDGEVNQLVAVADGSWSRLKKYYSEDFMESVVEE